MGIGNDGAEFDVWIVDLDDLFLGAIEGNGGVRRFRRCNGNWGALFFTCRTDRSLFRRRGEYIRNGAHSFEEGLFRRSRGRRFRHGGRGLSCLLSPHGERIEVRGDGCLCNAFLLYLFRLGNNRDFNRNDDWRLLLRFLFFLPLLLSTGTGPYFFLRRTFWRNLLCRHHRQRIAAHYNGRRRRRNGSDHARARAGKRRDAGGCGNTHHRKCAVHDPELIECGVNRNGLERQHGVPGGKHDARIRREAKLMLLEFMVTDRRAEHHREDRECAVGDRLERKKIGNIAAEHMRQRDKEAGDRGHPPADAYHGDRRMHTGIFRRAALEKDEQRGTDAARAEHDAEALGTVQQKSHNRSDCHYYQYTLRKIRKGTLCTVFSKGKCARQHLRRKKYVSYFYDPTLSTLVELFLRTSAARCYTTYMRTLFTYAPAMVRGVCFGAILVLPISALAATPSVASFNLSPVTISSSDLSTVSWRVVNSAGSSLSFTCPAGVSVKKLDGTAFPCLTRTVINPSVSGSATFRFTNISGTATTVIATLYPKDAAGNDDDSAIAQTSLTVGTAPKPVANAFASTTSPASGSLLAISWVAPDTAGTNLQLQCRPGLRYTGPDGITPLPCDTPAFPSLLAPTGSTTIIIFNDNSAPTTTAIRVLPGANPTLYDATHAAIISVTVGAKTAQQITPLNSGATTVSTGSTVSSGSPLNFSWTTQNSIGANLLFSCNSSLIYTNTVGTATQTLPCGVPAFSPVLPSGGTATLSFINNSTTTQQTTLSVLPQRANGIYDQSGGTNAVLLVTPAQMQATIAPAEAPATTASATNTPLPVSGEGAAQAPVITTNTPTAHAPLTTPLKRGSRGTQVTILQTFLAQDPQIYPEAAITGYFGAATKQAVQRFQDRYTISSQGDSNYGTVGPGTRAKINALTQP